MKKILLASLLIISILSLVGCNQKEDYCNHDFTGGRPLNQGISRWVNI